MKKILVLLTVTIVAVSLAPCPAEARQRTAPPALRAAKSAGAVLGTIGILGALTALDIIVDSAHAHGGHDRGYNAQGATPDCRRGAEWWNECPDGEGGGRWEWVEVWTPGHYEKVWIPEYRDDCGRRHRAHWERRYIEGRYAWKQVWVTGR